jgi:hypothetical protein
MTIRFTPKQWGFAAGRVFVPWPGYKFFVHIGPFFCRFRALSAAERASFYTE